MYVHTILCVQGKDPRQLDILVSNEGRVNFGQPLDIRKGLTGSVEVDGKEQKDWKIYSFEFKPSFIDK